MSGELNNIFVSFLEFGQERVLVKQFPSAKCCSDGFRWFPEILFCVGSKSGSAWEPLTRGRLSATRMRSVLHHFMWFVQICAKPERDKESTRNSQHIFLFRQDRVHWCWKQHGVSGNERVDIVARRVLVVPRGVGVSKFI